MNWRDYEEAVFTELSSHYMDDLIIKDHHIIGRYSKRKRQIDIYVEQIVNNTKIKIVVDDKYYNKKISVKILESFIGMADDVGADIALMITEKGFSKTSFMRAYNDPRNIELDILSMDELKHSLQGKIAIPFSGNNAVLISAPFGWIVDAQKRNESTCFLYNRGKDFDSSLKTGEFAYINFWDNKIDNYSTNEFSKYQERNITYSRIIENSEFFITENKFANDALIRVTKCRNYPLVEIAGYIRFKDFIFFCICNCPEKFIQKNTRKMILLIKYALPMKMDNS